MFKDQEKHERAEEGILRAIRTLGNGSVEVIVQDSKVVQVKVQFSQGPPDPVERSRSQRQYLAIKQISPRTLESRGPNEDLTKLRPI